MNLTFTNKKLIFTAGIIITLGILLFLLYQFYTNKEGNRFYTNGGFSREKLGLDMSLATQYDLQNDSYNIIDYQNNKIYLRQYQKNKILIFHKDNTKTEIPLGPFEHMNNIFSIQYNPFINGFDLQCNNARQILSVNMDSNKVAGRITFSNYYDRAIRISDSMLMTIEPAGRMTNQMQFNAVVIRDTPIVTRHSEFKIKSMIEDGTFRKWNDSYIYVNFYNNSFFVMDSNLNKRYSAKTIDTTTVLPKVKTIKNNTIVKFVTQPRVINKFVIIDGDFMYVNSMVRSDNEDKDALKRNVILDLYDLRNNSKYYGSIYLDRYNQEEMHDLLIKEGKIIQVYKDKLFVYDFSTYKQKSDK